MSSTRRTILGGLAAAGVGAATQTHAAPNVDFGTLKQRILRNFDGFPGTQAIKIWAPATDGQPEFLLRRNAAQRVFIGSAFKAFVLCERMRQLDGPDILTKITTHQLALNDSVWSPDSATFNPPELLGRVSERTAMEAMVLHSDNTGTDMVMKETDPDNVRAFLASAALNHSAIPDSTRIFIGYLLGAQNYKSFTWADVQAAANLPFVNSPLNGVETLASSADDLVSFYHRSIQGKFFQHPETLQQYRNILTLGDVITFVLPLGVSAFAKGGSIDVPGFHALCAPGAMYFAGRWVYFAVIINWYAPAETDPSTVARYLAAAQQAFAQLYKGLGGI